MQLKWKKTQNKEHWIIYNTPSLLLFMCVDKVCDSIWWNIWLIINKINFCGQFEEYTCFRNTIYHWDTGFYFLQAKPIMTYYASKTLFCQLGDCFLRFVIGVWAVKCTSLSHRYLGRPLRTSRSLLYTNCFKIITPDYMFCLCFS